MIIKIKPINRNRRNTIFLLLKNVMNDEIKNPPFELDEKLKEQVNLTMVKILFKILYQQNKISKKEFDSLIRNANRTPKLKSN